MHKASRELKETLAKVDLVIEILDARIPFSSENPLLAQIQGDKPCIKILNKCDLADPAMTEMWQTYFNQKKNITAYAVTKNNPAQVRNLINLSRKVAQKETCPDKTTTVLVTGIPNVGKSTLINTLAGRTIAKTGNEPAITKRQQRIGLTRNFALIDTPGILWPNLENQRSAYRLAATGAIKDTALIHQDIANFIIEYLFHTYPEKLKLRYGIEPTNLNVQQLIDQIGENRGCLKPGGVIDQDKVAKVILSDYRMANLGNITWETPQMMEQELIELESVRQQKALNKERRKPKQNKTRA